MSVKRFMLHQLIAKCFVSVILGTIGATALYFCMLAEDVVDTVQAVHRYEQQLKVEEEQAKGYSI